MLTHGPRVALREVVDRPPGDVPRQAGLQRDVRAVRHDAAGARRSPLRRAAPPRPRPPLRPAPGGRRGPGQLGRAEGPDVGSRRAAHGRARRGPPGRLLRLRGRDPRRRVRRRRRRRVGLGHMGARRGRRSAGRHRSRQPALRPRRREAARPLRVDPHPPRWPRPGLDAAQEARRRTPSAAGRPRLIPLGEVGPHQRRGQGGAVGELDRWRQLGRADTGRGRRTRRPRRGGRVAARRAGGPSDRPRQGDVPEAGTSAGGHEARPRALRGRGRAGPAAVPG